MKEQIEEIAKSCPYNVDGECMVDETRCTVDCEVAKWGNSIVEGYRKQSEGEWKPIVKCKTSTKTLIYYQCSLCGVYLAREANFCPNCGAKMKGGDSNE